MPRKTNAEWQAEIDSVAEQRDYWCSRYNELLSQISESLEKSPAYVQMQQDLKSAQFDRDMYKELYDGAIQELENLRQKEDSKQDSKQKLQDPKMGRPQVYGEDLRQAIRQYRAEGYSLRTIGQHFGVSAATVYKICDGIDPPKRSRVKTRIPE